MPSLWLIRCECDVDAAQPITRWPPSLLSQNPRIRRGHVITSQTQTSHEAAIRCSEPRSRSCPLIRNRMRSHPAHNPVNWIESVVCHYRQQTPSRQDRRMTAPAVAAAAPTDGSGRRSHSSLRLVLWNVLVVTAKRKQNASVAGTGRRREVEGSM